MSGRRAVSHLPRSVSLSTDREDSPLDYGALDVPDLARPSEPGPTYAGNMENFEMERYVLQSLELLASTPTTQYYGPEIPQSDVLPRSPVAGALPPRYDRWDGRQSFQHAHQSLLGGHERDQQACFSASSSTSAQSPTMIPIYTHLNYHDHPLPENNSPVESKNTSSKVLEPTLKRQRNTAASARFRAKKKRNDEIQARNAREREAVINSLENRVTELETENRWLKDLLIDKAEVTVRRDSRVIADGKIGSERENDVVTSST